MAAIAFFPGRKLGIFHAYDTPLRGVTGDPAPHLEAYRNVAAGQCAAFLADGKTLVAGYSEDIILWDVARRQPVRHFEDKKGGGGASLLRVSPDGKMLVALSGQRTIRLWEVSSGISLGQLQGVEQRILSLAFSPDSRAVVACAGLIVGGVEWPHDVILWEVPKAQPKWQTKLLGGVDSAAFFRCASSVANARARSASARARRKTHSARSFSPSLISALPDSICSRARFRCSADCGLACAPATSAARSADSEAVS